MVGRLRSCLAFLLVAASAMAFNSVGVAAKAASYPSRLIKIIVPFTPGSPNDVMARLLAKHIEPRLGQSVIIENRPGGGTLIGTKAVAAAAPDGYTLLFVSSALVIDPSLHSKLGYDPVKDFAPIATVTTAPWLLAISPQVPAKSVKEFVADAKAHPGEMKFGFAQGTASQLVGERFKKLTGTDILSVPYKGGAAALPDFFGGRIQMLVPTPATTLGYIRAGKMRALAITSVKRSPDLPEVPTFAEAGLPQLTLEFWAGMLAPAGTPPDIVEKLNATINAALRSDDMRASMRKLNFEAKIGSPQDFAAFIKQEIPRWAAIVKSTGVHID